MKFKDGMRHQVRSTIYLSLAVLAGVFALIIIVKAYIEVAALDQAAAVLESQAAY
jgi:hypothetical protein